MFRHGSEAVRICDEALSVSGPSDPRIAKIIQTDQNAQMAYHVHKALGFALEVRNTVCTVILHTTYYKLVNDDHVFTHNNITGVQEDHGSRLGRKLLRVRRRVPRRS